MNFFYKFHKTVCFLVLALFSCQKSGNGYVKGTVYEAGTSVPIANAVIKLTTSYHAGNEQTIDFATTDKDGKYEIKYKHKRNYGFFLYVSNLVEGSHMGVGNKKLVNDFYLTPPAFLKVWANKTSFSNNYLLIDLKPSYFPFAGVIASSNNNAPYNELIRAKYVYLDYSPYFQNNFPNFIMKANSNYTLSWVVYDNNGPTPAIGQAQFNVNKGDTVSYTILFN